MMKETWLLAIAIFVLWVTAGKLEDEKIIPTAIKAIPFPYTSPADWQNPLRATRDYRIAPM